MGWRDFPPSSLEPSLSRRARRLRRRFRMASAGKQVKWFIDTATEQIYRVVLTDDGTAVLESDDLLQIVTTTLTLQGHFQPFVMPHIEPLSS